MNRLIKAALCLFLISCSPHERENRSDEAAWVPLTVLVRGAGAQYNGKTVHTFGFLVANGTRLYLTRDHAEGQDLASAVVVAIPGIAAVASECWWSYVYVTGKYMQHEPREPNLVLVTKIETPRLIPSTLEIENPRRERDRPAICYGEAERRTQDSR